MPPLRFLPKRPPEAISFREGDLARVGRDRKVQAAFDPNDRMRWQAMLAHIACERGYKPGWVPHKFREKFGTWPPVRNIEPIPPSPEVLSWVRSRAIAYAKARQKGTAA